MRKIKLFVNGFRGRRNVNFTLTLEGRGSEGVTNEFAKELEDTIRKMVNDDCYIDLYEEISQPPLTKKIR